MSAPTTEPTRAIALIGGLSGVLVLQLLAIALLWLDRQKRMAKEAVQRQEADRVNASLDAALEHRQRYDSLLEFLRNLSQQSSSLAEEVLVSRVLETAVAITGSRVGFLRRVDGAVGPDTRELCRVECSESEERPSLTGDGRSSRRIDAAVSDGGVVREVIEVAGKGGDYDDEDRRSLLLLAAVLRKVRTRRATQAALRESEARFRLIADLSPGLIWVADAHKECVWFNRTWLDFTGRSMAQELGNGWVQGVHVEDLDTGLVLAAGQFDARQSFDIEFRLRRYDGEFRWLLSSGRPRFDDSGAFKGYVGTCIDISKRKRAEQEREQFQTFFALSSDMMCIAGVDGFLRKVNPAFTKVLGYSQEELLSRRIVEFLLPEDRLATEEEVSKLYRGQGTAGFENRYRCKDGTVRRLSWNVFVDDRDGLMYATVRDFTELRAAEAQLNKLSMAVQQTSQALLITNVDACIEYVNQAFCDITGYAIDEVLGQNPRILNSGETPSVIYQEMWAALRRGEVWKGEFNNRRKDGSIYIGSARISPVRQADGQITHYLGIQEDVTEFKRTMETIRESKALLQSVVDATPDWLYVKDREHRLVLVNQQCAESLGMTPGQMVGRHDTDFIPGVLRIGNNDSTAQRLHEENEAVFSGASIYHPHEEVFFENGESRVFDSRKLPMRDSTQRIYGVLCYRRDITEDFNKEQKQQALEAQLRQAQKMELIGHLTGGIAHDFNNILSAVFGYAELMQMSPEIKTNALLEQYLHEILQAGIRAKELVSQLLTFSHRRETASEAILVAPIVHEVARLLRSTISTSITIECALADEVPEVLISAVHLYQVLMNLGVNARDAMTDTGHIKIAVESTLVEQAMVCTSCRHDFSGPLLTISVSDTGSGIAPDNLSRIFDPFFTTKGVGRGSGLGLSVLHGIVHSANGHITARSVLGKGTEVCVYLPPHASDHKRAFAATRVEKKRPLIRGTVMVVDDEASIVRFMTVLLEDLGCTVIALTSPIEALRMFEADPGCVDLVLTDQTMPELSGVELARAMLACRPSIPIVLSTGYSNAVDEDVARQVGIRRFLMKPVPAKVFADLVADFLPGSASEPPDA